MTTFKRIMRYNNYLKDPYSLDDGKPDAADAICARGDLTSRQSAGGCYDGKVTSFKNGFHIIRMPFPGADKSKGSGDVSYLMMQE